MSVPTGVLCTVWFAEATRSGNGEARYATSANVGSESGIGDHARQGRRPRTESTPNARNPAPATHAACAEESAHSVPARVPASIEERSSRRRRASRRYENESRPRPRPSVYCRTIAPSSHA